MFTNILLASSFGDVLNNAFYEFDMAIFSFFGSMQNGFLTAIAKIFTAMGSTKYVALLAVMGLVLCFFKRTRKVGFALVFAVIIGTLITNIIVKPAVLRIRPYNTLQGEARYWAWYLGAGRLCESDYSFPSGHTTGAFEVATALFLCHFTEKKKGVAWIFPVVAFLTAMSRVYLMVHYATDVIAAIFVGIIAGILGYLLSSVVTKAIRRRKIDDIVDLTRLFKNGISMRAGAIAIGVAWALIFGFSYLTSLDDGGENTIRCAYDREYDCQNEAQVDSKKYPAINGQYYCKIHWKQLNEQFAETGTIEEPAEKQEPFSSSSEPVVNTDFFSFFNDPVILSFRDNFAAAPPVKLICTKGGNDVVVTDQALIQQVFDGLSGVQVGAEAATIKETEVDESVYYTFVMEDESTITLGIEYPYTVFYNGKYYDITNDNGAFSIIPDDYWEGIEPTTADAA
ncbi:MAG: phosphatase PAP2 family protein [Parasporobacterium sp.]|nr:phosphatase PAP2 family protein [Parasporobacterium sp.]